MNSIGKTTAVALGAALMLAGPARADLTIGFSAPLSGPVAAVGQDQYDGFMLGIETLGGKLGGQKVTVLREDDQLKPELGNQIARKFVDHDKVDAVVGLGFSNVLMASLPRLVESGTVAIATNAGPSVLAGARCASNVFSVAWQNDGSAEAMGKYAQDAGYKRVYLMAPNYQAGKDFIGGFKRFYRGEILDEVYTAVGQPDYSAEIAQLQAADPEAVFVFYPGGMGVNFVKQFSQAGLAGRIPLLSAFTVDGTTLPSLREAALGTVSGAMWDVGLDTPGNAEFIAAFTAKYGRAPSAYAAVAYDAARLLDLAFARAGGDRTALAAAVKAAGAELKSVRGPFHFGSNNMPVQNYYAFETVKQGGKVTPRKIGTPLAGHADAYAAQCAM
ncbi:ABC transporter substrate-binding protein [Denitromonas iodatirespirans]|uniref:ABC transporter substrate-binding protein n=1 Tax=Denitromonas iodatirespirans TaxID=2795389 RepID=A0A944H8C9_DENI1|nr:ABC transporter substrate-binding protein [Denitromonas iodatirespirans]MBT0962168.1 ABC transporter substrate-binding protein [Denitromonas iodatirespirans]